tara:strand:+ start:23638 stop:24321 length:684 start_codon:yes stop_codon:yes gene_type:complete
MPSIPTLSLTNPNLNLEDIYKGVYAPDAGLASSLEALNGGLDDSNYGSGKESIEPWMVQNGTFAQGFYHGFDRWEHMYGYQASSKDSHRIVHAGLSTKVFLPWDANVVMYGFQAWFEHDADYDSPIFETWHWRLKIKSTGVLGNVSENADEQTVLQGKLPWGRSSVHPVTSFMPEEQWRYVHKQGMLTSVNKGFFTFELDISANLKEDNGDSKIKTPTGGVWVLALR